MKRTAPGIRKQTWSHLEYKSDNSSGVDSWLLKSGDRPLYGEQFAAVANCMKHGDLGSHLAQVLTNG